MKIKFRMGNMLRYNSQMNMQMFNEMQSREAAYKITNSDHVYSPLVRLFNVIANLMRDGTTVVVKSVDGQNGTFVKTSWYFYC